MSCISQDNQEDMVDSKGLVDMDKSDKEDMEDMVDMVDMEGMGKGMDMDTDSRAEPHSINKGLQAKAAD
ncbi:hypothetical protein SAMN04487897_102273 [Paenibacillus sp. yr247]|nr:hypothetical protein SAMN04487897_102273 [Paenibacillus sp. yr247]